MPPLSIVINTSQCGGGALLCAQREAEGPSATPPPALATCRRRSVTIDLYAVGTIQQSLSNVPEKQVNSDCGSADRMLCDEHGMPATQNLLNKKVYNANIHLADGTF